MRHPESVAQLLSTVPEGGDEWQFWSAVAKLIDALDPPRTTLYGFACMYVFELADVSLKGGGGIGGTMSGGGIENLARIIAVLFANCNAELYFRRRQGHGLSPDSSGREVERSM